MSGEHGGHVRDVMQRQPPDAVGDHGDLNCQHPQRQTGSHVGQSFDRQLLVIVCRSQNLAYQVKEGFHRYLAT